MHGTVREMRYGKMLVKVFRTRDEMGAASAEVCAREIRKQLTEKEERGLRRDPGHSRGMGERRLLDTRRSHWDRVGLCDCVLGRDFRRNRCGSETQSGRQA